MPGTPKNLDAVPVGRIYLALENPRHEKLETEGQAIEYLCANEDVYPLAKDIAKHGLNPLERLALVPVDKRKPRNAQASYKGDKGDSY